MVTSGTPMTQFGRSEDLDLLGLAVRAAVDAVADAGVDRQTIDAVYLASFLAQSLQRQGVLASLVARELGLRAVPTTLIEGACASAGIVLRHGVMACRAGMARTMLCVGAEQMTRSSLAEVTAGMSEALESRRSSCTKRTRSACRVCRSPTRCASGKRSSRTTRRRQAAAPRYVNRSGQCHP